MKFNKQKMILSSLITIPFLVVVALFCYLWIYMPYVYGLDLEKIKIFSLSDTDTVEDRVNAINGLEKVTWISGEFFPCAIVELKDSDKLDLCFVISDGKLYAKNEDTIKYFPELKISYATIH
jgi:hypothetical protein